MLIPKAHYHLISCLQSNIGKELSPYSIPTTTSSQDQEEKPCFITLKIATSLLEELLQTSPTENLKTRQ